jgi:hypothetical protein
MTPEIHQVLSFAKQHRGDCSSIATFVILKETGLLQTWMKRQRRLGKSVPVRVRPSRPSRP